MILRKDLPVVVRLVKNFACVGIVGARQVGKTTLVKQLGALIDKPTVYFDLENLDDYQKFEENPVWFLEQYENHTVIIDEIQRKLPLIPLLRSLIDKKREPSRFILLGSASPEFLARSTETLAGRIAYHELPPIGLEEAQNVGIDSSKLWFRGGFPEALLMPDDSLWFEWQANFIRTYIDSDLRLLGLSAQPPTIARLLRILTTVQGSLINYSDIANVLDVTMPTVKNYIDFLEHAFIVRRLYPFHTNMGKRLVKTPKLYIRDTGNLHYLLNISNYESLINHNSAGHSWEGYMIEQVLVRLKKNVLHYFYRTQHGSEIDLVLTPTNEPLVSIEIKLSNNPSLAKTTIQAAQDLGTTHNFILTPNGGDYLYAPMWRVCNVLELVGYLQNLNLTS